MLNKQLLNMVMKQKCKEMIV
ncbi:hypothetical protein KsCSTR_32100 [Candidatus Kuenenia stuttgartiensis]|uniref:Uncharacterized protein n=1 Tax=Kuenenia stuttgartiensis TaxID=174633 RepID=A0A6G7GTH3_KUEST|nr:hypothetical protein KsCSTR_32100 [Candidatus Kuenenia stuttgartiensis]